MSIPSDLFYGKTHEWLRIDDHIATIGITDFAQNQISDLTFIELPEVGREVVAREEVAVLESVKAASDIYAPIAGTIVEVNSALEDAPEIVNQSPYGKGWIFKIKFTQEEDVDDLLSAEEYEDLCAE